MITEKKMKPIEIQLAAKLAGFFGYRWKYLRQSALERIAEHGTLATRDDEYVSAYHKILRAARFANKFLEAHRG